MEEVGSGRVPLLVAVHEVVSWHRPDEAVAEMPHGIVPHAPVALAIKRCGLLIHFRGCQDILFVVHISVPRQICQIQNTSGD